MAQGYEIGPALIYQDNMSCMALYGSELGLRDQGTLILGTSG